MMLGFPDPHSNILIQPLCCLCSEDPHARALSAHLQTLIVCHIFPLLSPKTKTHSAGRETTDKRSSLLEVQHKLWKIPEKHLYDIEWVSKTEDWMRGDGTQLLLTGCLLPSCIEIMALSNPGQGSPLWGHGLPLGDILHLSSCLGMRRSLESSFVAVKCPRAAWELWTGILGPSQQDKNSFLPLDPHQGTASLLSLPDRA